MKVKLLAGLLAASLVMNAAGIVFFVFYLTTSGRLRHVTRERNQLRQNLNVVQGASLAHQVLASPPERFEKRTFFSHFDGQPDTYAFMPPVYHGVNSTKYTLVVYLHGMGSTFLEPFIYPQDTPIYSVISSQVPNVIPLSCNYRKASSWGNDAAMTDISQNIRELSQQFPVEKIVMMGSSMGGCVALSYAAQAPDDIKAKITGVVSAESAGDLIQLYKKSKDGSIRPALINAFGGTPEQVPETYRKQSFLANIDGLPKHTRVFVISARRDDIVPPAFQRDIVKALDERKIVNKLVEVDMQHGVPSSTYYIDGLNFVMGKG